MLQEESLAEHGKISCTRCFLCSYYNNELFLLIRSDCLYMKAGYAVWLSDESGPNENWPLLLGWNANTLPWANSTPVNADCRY